MRGREAVHPAAKVRLGIDTGTADRPEPRVFRRYARAGAATERAADAALPAPQHFPVGPKRVACGILELVPGGRTYGHPCGRTESLVFRQGL